MDRFSFPHRFRCYWLHAALTLSIAFGVSPVSALSDDFVPPSVTATNPQVEAQIDHLLGQLTLEEKIELIAGDGVMSTEAIPRLGIPALRFSDGPVGVRCWGKSTGYPANILVAATWDPAAARSMGTAIGRDARARGVHVELGPGMNIYREAQCGRNFEYVGEDPFLASVMITNYVQGLQSQRVAACIKHFAGNEEESNRNSMNVIVSRRALEEIYFPPFRAAIEDGNAWTAMCAYNKLNGEWCSANKFLLTDILRDEWNYQGLLMSDWGAAHDTLKDLNAGLDLEMGGGARRVYNDKTVPPLLQSGQVTQATLDEHVRRFLRLVISMGFMKGDQTDSSIPLDDPQNSAAAEKIASEGIVLLKNENDLLPLDRTKIKHIVVIGPNATPAVTAGGGSSRVTPFREVSLLDAIRSVAGDGVEIENIPDMTGVPNDHSSVYPAADCAGETGLRAEYFTNKNLKGKPFYTRIDKDVQFNWGADSPVEGIPGESSFSVGWTGFIRPAANGDYLFATSSDDGSRVFVDDQEVVDNWRDHALTTRQGFVHLQADHVYRLRIEYYNNISLAEMQFGWTIHKMPEELKKSIVSADAVIFSGGLSAQHEEEGRDRPWKISPEQDSELHDALALNRHVIAVINAGGNLGLGDNLDRLPALLWAWYPGQNGNTPVAKILFGDLNPSGHLPDTFEKRFEDAPAYGNFPGDLSNGGTVHFDEGIYIGYRWFDKKNIAPAFPFGFGLSYTKFKLDNLQIAGDGQGDDRQFTVTVQVTNTGARDGAEVVQLYVRPPAGGTIDRPLQELRAFARVDLKAGETKPVTLTLTKKAFSLFDEKSSAWIAPPGDYEIAVGTSSRDIAQTGHVAW